ncbi:MAG: PAS domain S-box protein, partial [Anaerolineae bacterium]
MSSSQPVILLVDPYPQPNISQTLRQHGFTVNQTATETEALVLAVSQNPALIILEIDLPTKNSFELCRQLKDNPLTTTIPILLCAETYQDATLQSQALASPAAGFVTHSTEPLVLLSLVKTLLSPSETSTSAEQQAYHLLVEHSLQGLVIIQNRQVVFVNPAATAITGYTPDEVQAPNFDAFKTVLHPADQARALQRTQERLTGQLGSPHHEYRIIRRDGRIRWIESFTSLIQYRGQPALQIAFVDVTERKQAEEAWRKFERIVSATTDGLSLVDRNYIYRLVNHTYLTLYNKRYEEIVGHSVEELLGSEAFKKVIKTRLDDSLAGQTVSYQQWFTFPTRGRRFMNVTYSPYIEPDGIISGVVVTVRDLTDLKQAEEALRESQYMLQLVMDHAPQSISWKDKNLIYLGCNRRFSTEAGLASPAEIVGKTDFNLPWREYAEYYSTEDSQIINSGTPKLNYEEFQTTSTGEEICVQVTKIPLHNAQGDIIGLLGMFEDITERIQTEQALRNSEAHSRALLEAIPDMICRIDSHGRFLQIKVPLDFDSIYPVQELIGATIHTTYPPEQANLLVDLAQAAIASYETQHAEIYFENQEQPIYRDIRFAACGQDEALMIVRDITQRKRIEEVLFNTQELLSAFIKYSPALVFVVSVDDRILLVNQAWEQFFGLQHSRVTGRLVTEIFPPEIANRFLASNQQVVESLAPIKFEQILMTGTNTPYYEEVIKFPIFDASGQIEAIGGIATDITGRKEAELKIQRRNRELDLLNRVIAASVKVTEPEILLDSVCRALAQTLDLPMAYAGLLNIAKTSITIVAEYLAIEQSSWLQMEIPNPPVNELLFRRAPLVVDLQNERRSAVLPQQVPLQGLATALVLPLISEGELLGILSLITTTTHHYSAEEINLAWSVADQAAGVLARTRLIQAQQLLSVAIEQAGENVIITDPNGLITYVNPAFEKLTGYNEAEVIGQAPRIL